MNVIVQMLRALLAVAAFVPASLASAQDYPDRPVTLVVPYPAGGATDLVARILTRSLANDLGQPVIVENAPGASGMIGMTKVARAKPDGYTLGWGLNGPMTIVPYMIKAPLYDPARAFAPVGLVATSSYLMVARPGLSVRSLQDLIVKATAAPGKYSYGSVGIGSSTHLLTELVMSAANINLLHVPYKGEAETIRALLASEIDVSWLTVQTGAPFVAEGKLTGVLVTGTEREPSLPAIPTMSESGRPDLTVETFFGVLVPAGTPEAVVGRLSKAMAAIRSDPDYMSALANVGLKPASTGPEAFAVLLERHQQRWLQLIKARNIVAE